jgi:hypothetical protein
MVTETHEFGFAKQPLEGFSIQMLMKPSEELAAC